MKPSLLLSPPERRRVSRAWIVCGALTLLIVAAVLISMNTGLIRLSPAEVIRTAFGAGTEKQELILYQFRLPRILISLLIGAGLAVAGCILQGLTRNALADPGILGIHAGAGLAVIAFVSLRPSAAADSIYALPLLALLGASAAAALVFALAYSRRLGISPSGLILSGIAVAAGLHAATIVLTLRLNPEKYQFAAAWLAGTIWGTNWKFVWALLPWIAILLPYAFAKAEIMNLIRLGDAAATGLGVPVRKEQPRLIAVSVGLAGACVAVGGGIGFVGLIGPHLARRLVGPRHQALLPASALVGALLVMSADTIGRAILQPTELPAGLVVAVIGAPYFLYLLAKSRA